MAKKEVKEVDIISFGKLTGVISAIFGLFAGGIITIFTLIAGSIVSSMTNLPPEVQQMIPMTSMMGTTSMGIGVGIFSILPIGYWKI